MNDDQPPIGQRYTHVYLKRGGPQQDSKRFRTRLGQKIRDLLDQKFRARLQEILTAELGVEVDYLPSFLERCTLRDLLDSITICGARMVIPRPSSAVEWRKFVKRALAEENLGYRIDEQFGIHPTVDIVFEAERVAVIQVLSGKRHKATLDAFEDAHKALEANPPNLKGAIRLTFDAVENLFKLMCPGAPRLAREEIEKRLLPLIERPYPEQIARRAANKLAASLADWIDGAQFYRHSPGTVDPVDPPIEFAVVMMSTGAGFLRWLAEMDRALNPQSK